MASGSKRSATAEAPPPPPPPSQATTAQRAQPEKIEAKHMGVDPWRPLRYTGSFIWGTIKGAMDGLAVGGRRGLWVGIIAGIALAYLPFFLGAGTVGFSLSGLIFGGATQVAVAAPSAFAGLLANNIFTGMVAGFIGGAVVKSIGGLLTGGVLEVGRSYRKEKYADDLAYKEEARASRRARQHLSYDDRHANKREAASFNVDRLAQQDRRNQNEVSTYWQDHVSSDGRGAGRGF